MMMNKHKKIAILVCAIIILVTYIYFGVGYYVTRTNIIDMRYELNNVQNSLDVESTKLKNTQNELDKANEIISSREGDIYFIDCEVTDREIDMLAKTVWGEARGCNRLQQSAVVWCILNRVDADWGTIAEVIKAPGQFHGYNNNYPVTDEIKELVKDVVARWKLEKIICGEVGRTLPKNYLYFCADSNGLGNVFRDKYNGDYKKWDWDCWNPYE